MLRVDVGPTARSAPLMRPGLERVRAYVRSPQPPWVDLLLDANEGPPVAQSAVDALAMVSAAALAEYPRVDAFETALAAKLGVAADAVIATAGGDEAIDRVCRAFVAAGRRLVLAPPTFEMIRHYGLLAGAEIVETPWEGDRPPIDGMIAAATPNAVIALVSPNNPTGSIATRDDLLRLADARPDCLVLFDHAYAEFADEDLTSAALTRGNIVTIRTFSKAYSAAGLRLGYAVGDPGVIGALRAAGGPFNVTTPTIAAGLALINRGVSPEMIARVRAERRWLTEFLSDRGLEVPSSQANFVLVRGPRAGILARGLAAMGIAVRSYGPGPLEHAVRITCPGSETRMARLRHALKSVLRPSRLVLDRSLPDDPIVATLAPKPIAIGRAKPSDGQPGWFITGDPAAVDAARRAGLTPFLVTTTPDAAERIGALQLASIDQLPELLP